MGFKVVYFVFKQQHRKYDRNGEEKDFIYTEIRNTMGGGSGEKAKKKKKSLLPSAPVRSYILKKTVG